MEVEMFTKDALHKSYDITIVAKGVKSIKVTFPYEVVEREARRRGLTVEEFVEQYQAIAEYDNFDGVFYRLERKPKEATR